MEYNTGIDDFKLKDANPNDCENILKLIKAIAKYEKMEDSVTATKETLYDSLFVKNSAKVILAYYRDNLIGYMLYFFNFSTFTGTRNIYLEDLFLFEEYRHKGYGSIMLKILANIAVASDVKRIDWICLNWNKPSLDFYKSINAKALDYWILHRLDETAIKELAK